MLGESEHRPLLRPGKEKKKANARRRGLALRRIGGDFVDLDGLLPFGGDGVAFIHRHGGVLHEHLRATAAAPGQEVQEMVFADRFGAGRRVGNRLAILNATIHVMHSGPLMVA